MKRIDEEPTQEQIRDSLENDRLGRRGTVERFIHLLSIIEGPYSLFIDSPWGTGKTFFVKQVAKVLKSANPNINIEDRMEMPVLDDDVRQRLNDSPIRPVYFNAWENDHFDDPIAPLLATIASEADDADTKSGKSVHDIIAGAIECAFSACGTNVGRLIDSISGEDFLDAFKKSDELRLMLSELTSALIPEKANKVVLFIDELDRCRPEFATRLLEQTKSLFRQDGVIVVYSTDMTQLAYSLQGLYGPNYGCQKYLQRFYDFRFELPRISPIKYLDAKCANIHTSYCFTDIALRYIELHDSMPTHLQQVLRQAQSRCSIYRQQSQLAGRYPYRFFEKCIAANASRDGGIRPKPMGKGQDGQRFQMRFRVREGKRRIH